MAGSNKNNTLKELFIKIGIIGAKDAVKALDKVEDKTDEVGKSAKESMADTNAFMRSLKALGTVATKTGRILKRLGGPILRVVRFGFRGIVGVAKLAMRAVSGLARSFGRVLEIATGISLSNVIDSAFSKIRSLSTKALDLAVDEESSRFALRQAFALQGRPEFADRFLKTLSDLQKRFGTSSTELAKAFRGTSIPIAKLARAAEVVAKIGVLRPNVNPGVIARQLGQLLKRGVIEETLKDIVPAELLNIKDPLVRMAHGLEIIEKSLEKVGSETNRTFAFRSKLLDARFDELLRTAGRPVRDTLNTIMGVMLRQGRAGDLSGLGDAIARVIATFARDFFLGGASGSFLRDLNRIGANVIKFGGVLLKDITDFILGRASALQQVFLPGETAQSATILGLLKSMITELINFAVDRVKEAFRTEDSRKFLNGIGQGVREGAIGGSGSKVYDYFFSPSTKTEDIQDDLSPLGGDGLRPNIPDQGAVNFNTNIQIATQQPATTVRNQLANQMALIGNQGRTA